MLLIVLANHEPSKKVMRNIVKKKPAVFFQTRIAHRDMLPTLATYGIEEFPALVTNNGQFVGSQIIRVACGGNTAAVNAGLNNTALSIDPFKALMASEAHFKGPQPQQDSQPFALPQTQAQNQKAAPPTDPFKAFLSQEQGGGGNDDDDSWVAQLKG